MVKTFHQKNVEKNQQMTTSSPVIVKDTDITPKTFHGKQSTVMDNNQPKPLFKPNVQATADEQSLQQVQGSIARLQLDDYEFSASDIAKATLLKAAIRIDDPSYVTDYGAEACQQSETILNQLNTISRNDYAEGVRKYLGYILTDTQKVDIEAISKGGEKSFFSRLFSNGISTKSDFLGLERDIKSNMTFCQNRLNQLKKTQQIFSELFAKNEQQFKDLTQYLLAGQLRLEEEQQLMQQQNPVAANVFAQQALIDKQNALSRFERRLQTLKVLRHTVLLRIGQLRLEQQNTLTLIDQANETLNLVVPAWKQQILALFSLSSSDNNSLLYQQLADTQQSLHQKLLSLNETKERS
ncbi:toxic anion resistance protein [uncultured Agitococcus sp.]|uniref:toxic anion resistance protein n=1 Tax=uncultured Agitococcus sp. TaxID=1506599 RepID=UPI00261CDEA5|nr:toxic anion resistance protein [uncultured Agitococcus sp.]